MKQIKHNDSQAIIGRTISGIISRPVSGGGKTLVMLQFSDGSCFEFVSPRSAKVLDKITRLAQRQATVKPNVKDGHADGQSSVPPQLSMFPQDGANAATHLAA